MKRKIEVSPFLKDLALIIGRVAPLYIVGGYIRNSIMGIRCDDVDIASPIKPDMLIKLLNGSDYQIIPVNQKLGTLLVGRGNEKYEFTSFRIDSYPLSSGIHKPDEIEFTSNIELDAARRDFTVNSIYYDIVKEEIIDVFGGVNDIENKILRTTVNPSRVFSEDGLRIMRLIRFAAELDYTIEADTYSYARENVKLLSDIAGERINIELTKILNADSKYNLNPHAHYNGVKLLKDIGALQMLLGKIPNQCIEILKHTESSIRLIALLYKYTKDINVIEEKLNNLKFKKADIKRNIRLLTLLRSKYKTDKDSLINLIIDNKDIINDFVALLSAINSKKTVIYKDAIITLLNEIRDYNLPSTLSELTVNGNDLIELDVLIKQRAEILRELLIYAITNRLNNRDALLKVLKEKRYD